MKAFVSAQMTQEGLQKLAEYAVKIYEYRNEFIEKIHVMSGEFIIFVENFK